MGKQQETLLQNIVNFVAEFDSNPFQDFYVLLVFRFVIYLYLFVKLSDILMGYEKPNIKTRVLRKFQMVYGGDILKEMDNQDMQQLEVTISNTILNATKDLKPKTHQKVQNDSILKDSCAQSERRSLKVDEVSQLSGSSLSKKSSKLRFDLQRNQYFDPPTENLQKNKQQIPSLKQQEVKQLEIESNLGIQEDQQVEGYNEEQKLSPTSQSVQLTKNRRQQKQEKKFFNHITDSQQELQLANTHYPQQEINTLNLEVEQKQAKDMLNLLHLTDEQLNDQLLEIQHQQINKQLLQNKNQQSALQEQTTNFTDQNYQQDINS